MRDSDRVSSSYRRSKHSSTRSTSRDRDRDRERDRDRDKDRERERDRDKDRERERDRDKDRERERDRDKDRERERDRDKDRERDRYGRRYRSKSPSRSRSDKSKKAKKSKKSSKYSRRSRSSSSSSSSTSSSRRSSRSHTRPRSSRAHSAESVSRSAAAAKEKPQDIDLMDFHVKKALETIEEDSFVPKTFYSTRDREAPEKKPATEKVIIDLEAETVIVPKPALQADPHPGAAAKDQIFHAMFLGDAELRQEKWIRKLFAYRQRYYRE